MKLTEIRDLRGGRPCWIAENAHGCCADPLPDCTVDVAIIGAGIMGVMLADQLASSGRSVALLDRRPPGHGSTAASTALVMWAADVPLTHLARRIGAAEAARRWRRIYATVRRFSERIDAESIDCSRIDRPELYLAGTLLDEKALQDEGHARRDAGLPSEWLDADAVTARFHIAPRAALLSAGSYEVDPVRLTLGVLDRARRHGATATFPIDVVALEHGADAITVRTADDRSLAAGQVVLATGYERPTWFLPPAFSVVSSYAIATPQQTAPLWRENAMIWEASSPYIYARATADGRVIAGGEDEDFADAGRRDPLIGAKSGVLRAKLAALIGIDDIALDCVWGAAFGASPDGLPAIGRAVNHDRLWLASGFGGNGVSFAALGAELITAALDGSPDPDAECFDPYRFG